jgi:hypothetical protein
MRATVLACLLLLACGLGSARAGQDRHPIGLGGVPGVVTPPDGTWKERTDSAASGEWFAEYRSEDGDVLMRVFTFPVRHGTDPEATIVHAMDVFFRGLGVSGFGAPTRRKLDVLGRPGAQASLVAVVEGKRVGGDARLVLIDEGHWAFAIGFAKEGGPPARRDAVRAFVSSLEPAVPSFYDPTFHDPASMQKPLVEVGDEAPLAGEAFAAVERVLELGIGAPFPLGLKPPIRAALLLEARTGPPKTRDGFRAVARAVRDTASWEPDKRATSLRAAGIRILETILGRAAEGHRPAMDFAKAWKEFRAIHVGEGEEALRLGDLASRIEMSEFLASVFANRKLAADAAARKPMAARVQAAWAAMPAEERKGWCGLGEDWRALRVAWDRASPADKMALRRALLVALGPEDQREAAGALAKARDVMAWIKAHPFPGGDGALLDAAFDLGLAQRRALVALLGVEDAYALNVGW